MKHTLSLILMAVFGTLIMAIAIVTFLVVKRNLT